MAIIYKQISVDVSSENRFHPIIAKQYDSNSRFLTVQLTHEGQPIFVNMTSTVTINALREDGEASCFRGSVNENGTIIVPISSWILELDGQVKCDISVIDSEQRKLTSTTFMISVEEAAYSGEHINEDENYDILLELIADCREATTEGKQIFANALKGKESGYAVALSNVSPVEHNVKVKLLSETATDFTKVKCEALGKNILAPVTWKTYSKNGVDFERREDGGVVVNGTSTAVVVANFPNPTLKHGVSYAISLKQSGTGSVGNGGLFVTYVNSEGTTVRLKGSAAGRDKVVWEREYTLSSVGLQIDANKTFNNTVFYPQIEIGEAITDYEPYIKPIQYTPNADGTVDGVVSISPSMTLQTDTDGVTVEAEYNKDTNKIIEKLTQAIISLGGNV